MNTGDDHPEYKAKIQGDEVPIEDVLAAVEGVRFGGPSRWLFTCPKCKNHELLVEADDLSMPPNIRVEDGQIVGVDALDVRQMLEAAGMVARAMCRDEEDVFAFATRLLDDLSAEATAWGVRAWLIGYMMRTFAARGDDEPRVEDDDSHATWLAGAAVGHVSSRDSMMSLLEVNGDDALREALAVVSEMQSVVGVGGISMAGDRAKALINGEVARRAGSN